MTPTSLGPTTNPRTLLERLVVRLWETKELNAKEDKDLYFETDFIGPALTFTPKSQPTPSPTLAPLQPSPLPVPLPAILSPILAPTANEAVALAVNLEGFITDIFEISPTSINTEYM